MEDIIASFGVDGRLIIIQIINFLILMTALGYFLYTPILNLLRERREKIEAGLRDAEAAKAALESAEAEKGAVLSTAHAEAAEVARRAKVAATEKETVMVEEAREKAGTIVHQAEAEANRLKEEARKAAEADIAKAAVLMAEKILREKTGV